MLVEQDVNFTLSHPNFQKLLNSNATFDAVIIEIFLADALYGEEGKCIELFFIYKIENFYFLPLMLFNGT